MTDFKKELDDILTNDPLGLLSISRPVPTGPTANGLLRASFLGINDFLRDYGREPEEASRDIVERPLFGRLKGIRENPRKAAALRELDEFGLLEDVPRPEDIETIDDVLDEDIYGLLSDEADGEDPNEMFRMRNVPEHISKPDVVARRKACKDFNKYEPLFIEVREELKAGAKALRRYVGEVDIEKGNFFVLRGILLYVADAGEKRRDGRRINRRLHLVFDNAKESHMLQRSLARELSKDEGGQRIVDPGADISGDDNAVSHEDQTTGFVYVLKSKSKAPEIRELSNLYKIGFSRGPVAQRIKNASHQATYLMADVDTVAEYKIKNVNPQQVEALLHRFFSPACLKLEVAARDGLPRAPKEWFVVPLDLVDRAVELLISGEIVNYCYDAASQEIIEK